MKKTLRITAVVLVAIMLCTTLISCDLFGKKLKGTYESDLAILGVYTLDFEGKNVTVKVKSILGTVTTFDGTYEIEDDTITFTFVDENGEEVENNPFSGKTYTFEQNPDTGDITIGKWEFERVDD